MKILEKTLLYKGLKGSIEYSEPDKCYCGQVLNIRGLVSYEGETLEELEKDFRIAVDEYIEDYRD